MGLREVFTTINPLTDVYSTQLSIPQLDIHANGKGLSEPLSIASAYAEMAERISAGLANLEQLPFQQWYGEDSRIKNGFDTFTYLPGYEREWQDAIPNAIRVEDLLGHVKRLKQSDFNFIKNESELTSHWVDGYSLLNDRRVKVPLMLVRWISATNGLASGNTMEEAILHGAYECIERYAAIKAIRDRMTFPTITYESVKTHYLKSILNELHSSGVEVHIKNMSMELNTFITGVMFVNHNVPKNSLEHHSFKVGVAGNTDEALARCLLERCQGQHPKDEVPTPKTMADNDYMPIFFKGLRTKPLEFMKIGKREDL